MTLEAGSIAARSAADGSYLVRSVHDSRSLFATADRYGSSRLAPLRDQAPQPTGETDLELRLLGECGALDGLVRNPDGTPIAGAWVTVRCARSATNGRWDDWPFLWMATLPDGTFRFTGLHKGAAEVEVFAHGFAVRVEQTLIEEDQTRQIDVRVEKGFKVDGVVRTAEGAPVVGAYVHHGPGPGEEGYVWHCQMYAKTNAEGRYHLDFLPSGKTRLGAESRRPGSVSRAKTEVTGRTGDHLTWDPVLAEGGKIVGRLVDESGVPLDGWSVEAQTRVRLEYSPRSAKTDAQGRFEILDCPDVPFELAAYPPNPVGRFRPPAGATAEGVMPGKGDVLLTVTSTSKPTAYVLGKVVDEDGKALGGVQIWAHNEGTLQSSGAMTDKEEGSFQVGPMPAGTYSISLSRKDFPGWNLDAIDIAPDERRDVGTITIPARGRFELVLRREDGAIVDRPFVMMLKGRNGYPLNAEDGFTFKSDELYPGSYTLCPVGQNIATEQRTIEISPGETTRLELRCRAGIPQVFKFAPPLGERGPDMIRVVIHDSKGSVVLDRNSGFDISKDRVRTPSMIAGFAPGRYTYQGTSAGWESSGSFEVGDSTQPNGIIQASLIRTP
jgi:hypothetical protein